MSNPALEPDGNVVPINQVDPQVLANHVAKTQRELTAAMQELAMRTDQLIAARGHIAGLQEELTATREELMKLKELE